jgi:hypothetical protein
MSKDKGEKKIKKAPVTGGSKKVSDYQSGKKSSGTDSLINTKKK